MSYSIGSNTPQCGVDVLVDENSKVSYLSLVDDQDGFMICYEINGISSVLSLTTTDSQILNTLQRQ